MGLAVHPKKKEVFDLRNSQTLLFVFRNNFRAALDLSLFLY